MSKDARRNRRVPYMGPVRLSWEDARGESRFTSAKCVDVCEVGLRIESPTAIPPGTMILLQAERIKLAGSATVKHVTRYGGKYLIGFELSQPAGEKTMAVVDQPGRTAQP
jgi:hypothetical protein